MLFYETLDYMAQFEMVIREIIIQLKQEEEDFIKHFVTFNFIMRNIKPVMHIKVSKELFVIQLKMEAYCKFVIMIIRKKNFITVHSFKFMKKIYGLERKSSILQFII